MTEDTEMGNVFKILPGGKDQNVQTPAPVADAIPQNEYIITDINGFEHYADGFLLFTSQHIAVMRDTGSGALPVLVIPLERVAFAELIEDDEVFNNTYIEDGSAEV